MGRKRLSDDERRAKPLRIRLNDDERAMVDAAAEASGDSASGWARDVLLKAAKPSKRKAGESNPVGLGPNS